MATEILRLPDAGLSLFLMEEEALLLQREIEIELGSPPVGAHFSVLDGCLVIHYQPYATEAVSYVAEVLNWRDNK